MIRLLRLFPSVPAGRRAAPRALQQVRQHPVLALARDAGRRDQARGEVEHEGAGGPGIRHGRGDTGDRRGDLTLLGLGPRLPPGCGWRGLTVSARRLGLPLGAVFAAPAEVAKGPGHGPVAAVREVETGQGVEHADHRVALIHQEAPEEPFEGVAGQPVNDVVLFDPVGHQVENVALQEDQVLDALESLQLPHPAWRLLIDQDHGNLRFLSCCAARMRRR